MILTSRLLAILSLLVLGAHFYRDGSLVLAGISLLPALLLFIRRPWALASMQIVLCLGAAEWLRTMVALVLARQQLGMPYQRLQVILGIVAGVCLLGAGLLSSRRVWQYYSADRLTMAPPTIPESLP